MVPSRVRFSEIKMRSPLVQEVRVHELSIKDELLNVRDGGHVDEQVGW
jgi:hypothetical protein